MLKCFLGVYQPAGQAITQRGTEAAASHKGPRKNQLKTGWQDNELNCAVLACQLATPSTGLGLGSCDNVSLHSAVFRKCQSTQSMCEASSCECQAT
jgi:hypothetical protein